eukprot:357886-Chlamydomonas_euryale.AAC.13
MALPVELIARGSMRSACQKASTLYQSETQILPLQTHAHTPACPPTHTYTHARSNVKDHVDCGP